jgi:hypothetical protein
MAAVLSTPGVAQRAAALAPLVEGSDAGLLPYRTRLFTTRHLAQYRFTARLAAAPERDHRWEGAVVGGVTTAVLVGLFAHELCSGFGDDHCVGRAIYAAGLTAPIGAGIGALIGSLFPKEPAPTRS